MSRSGLLLLLVGGFVGGLVGAALITAARHGGYSIAGLTSGATGVRAAFPLIAPGLLVFLIFGLYWSFAARDCAETASAEPQWSTLLHRATVTIGVLLILLPAPGLVGRVLPGSIWIVGAGLAIELAGVVLAVLARRSLGRNWSSEVRIAADHQLVQSGLYRRVRHPIYASFLCLYLGLALQAGRLDALIGLTLIVLAYGRKIGLEERVLGERFGAAFESYRKSSWALIPPLF